MFLFVLFYFCPLFLSFSQQLLVSLTNCAQVLPESNEMKNTNTLYFINFKSQEVGVNKRFHKKCIFLAKFSQNICDKLIVLQI